MVRTTAFQAVNRGSIPRGATKQRTELVSVFLFGIQHLEIPPLRPSVALAEEGGATKKTFTLCECFFVGIH